ncbi:MAG: ATP-grasp domain-containing protein [Chloroflexota bacterium]
MTTTRHVLVTDAGRGSALAFIRALGRRGWRVTAADADPASPGFRSRYVTGRLVHARPTDDADAVVEAIHRVVRTDAVDLVIPITDDVGLPLAAARDRFDGLTVLALPDPGALEATHDKAATFELAERLGVPVPPTRLLTGPGDAMIAAATLGFPLVIKPGVSRTVRADGTISKHMVTYAGDASELARRLAELDPDTPVLLQRWVPGKAIGVEVLADRGRPLAAFAHRRRREVPVTGGASSLRESVRLDPALFDHAVRLLGGLRWTGLAMVEFRVGPDGVGYLMEINGRVWGSLPLAVRAGMDFPGRLADLLMDGPPPEGTLPVTDYRIGVRARNLRLDLAWIRAVLVARRPYPYLPWPPRRAALGALASLLDPRIKDDLLTRSDPGPGLAQLVPIVRDALGGRRSADD